jgi:large subunit ribosomal protein L32
MAVPKRKKSRSRTRRRRAQWKAAPVSLVPVFLGGREYLVPPAPGSRLPARPDRSHVLIRRRPGRPAPSGRPGRLLPGLASWGPRLRGRR